MKVLLTPYDICRTLTKLGKPHIATAPRYLLQLKVTNARPAVGNSPRNIQTRGLNKGQGRRSPRVCLRSPKTSAAQNDVDTGKDELESRRGNLVATCRSHRAAMSRPSLGTTEHH